MASANNSNTAKAKPKGVSKSSPPPTTTSTAPPITPQQQLLLKLPKGVLESPEEEEGLECVKRNFTKGSVIGFLLYATLSFAIFRWSPASSFVRPDEKEFRCYITVGFLVVVTNVSRFWRLLMREERVFSAVRHGILSGILLLQFITVASAFGMAFLPSPVMYDHVTGLYFHLFHWVEWIGLTFLMTFLIDNIDNQTNGGRPKYARAISLGTAASASLVFPHCPNRTTWIAVVVIAIILFSPLYVLLYQRTMSYIQVKKKTKSLETVSATDEEAYQMSRSSFLLTLVCSCCWTVLVATFIVICLAPQYVPLRDAEMKIILTLHYCVMEVISKIWYLTVLIDAYERVFDSNVRLARRMEELRRFMSVVWEFSSDVIVFSYKRNDDRYSARISPAFLNVVEIPRDFLDIAASASPGRHQKEVSLLLEITPSEGHFYVFAMDLSKPIDRDDVSRFKHCIKGERLSLRKNNMDSKPIWHRNLATIANLIISTFEKQKYQTTTVAQQQEIVCLQHFHIVDDAGNEKEKRCEAKISLFKDGQAVIAMRDISDRLEKFEAEKRLVEECAIKKKDAEANQFTRHEVKNGILAAIGLLDHVREGIAREKSRLEEWKALSKLQKEEEDADAQEDRSLDLPGKQAKLKKQISSDSISGEKIGTPTEFDTEATVAELDSTLHDILDTILDEVMAREIIYEKYVPRKEKLVVTEVLSTLRTGSSQRFPLTLQPENFPILRFDRQLLRHIYRNAVSNACKYGKLDGTVWTTLRCDEKEKRFTMEIRNEPGDGHEELLKLTDEEVANIFKKETRLNIVKANDYLPILGYKRNASESSGNGAWIMQKCAETLGGCCNISFGAEGTVLTFTCPVELVPGGGGVEAPDPSAGHVFELPSNTWGIVVDDSAIQRKLLDRSFRNSGIEDSRRVVLGKDVHEVTTFPETVAALLKEHPKDIFILIVDENLDVSVDGGARHETVSGSKSVKDLRESLDDSCGNRLLALIRSANDSPENIRTYMERAHGFLHKEPLNRGQILDAVEPWWRKRFSLALTARTSPSSSGDDVFVGPLPDDIRAVIESVNSLCSNQDQVVLSRRWQVIREKLHGLKGDLKIMSKNEDLLLVVKEIDSLKRFRNLPEDFVERWASVQRKVEDLLL